MITVVIATYGEKAWAELAMSRAYPSAVVQAEEILVGHDEDGDIASCRNETASHATGDWLVFLDADDELAPGYIDAMERAIQPNCLLAPIVQKVVRGRKRKPSYYRQVDLLKGNWLVIGTALERSLFEKIGGFVEYEHGFEDWALWFKCTKMGAEVVKVPDAIYRAYANPGSKHHQLWQNRALQAEMHYRVKEELDAWQP